MSCMGASHTQKNCAQQTVTNLVKKEKKKKEKETCAWETNALVCWIWQLAYGTLLDALGLKVIIDHGYKCPV